MPTDKQIGAVSAQGANIMESDLVERPTLDEPWDYVTLRDAYMELADKQDALVNQKLVLEQFAEAANAQVEALQARVDALEKALRNAREAIASLDIGGLGWGRTPHEMLGVNVYPLRDELLAEIDAALQPLMSGCRT